MEYKELVCHSPEEVSMPKFYAECGLNQGIFNTDNAIEACIALFRRIFLKRNPVLGPLVIASEAGFEEDIRKIDSPQEMVDQQLIFSTSSILRDMDLDEVADELDAWCEKTANKDLKNLLELLRDNDRF